MFAGFAENFAKFSRFFRQNIFLRIDFFCANKIYFAKFSQKFAFFFGKISVTFFLRKTSFAKKNANISRFFHENISESNKINFAKISAKSPKISRKKRENFCSPKNSCQSIDTYWKVVMTNHPRNIWMSLSEVILSRNLKTFSGT